MKKFLVILLSLGLLVAFSNTASAAEAKVRFEGAYYLVGVYDNNYNLTDNETSRAFYYTRTRIQPVFMITEGLKFTTRFDALEKQWGNTDFKGGFSETTTSRRQGAASKYNSAFNPKIQESIEFERGYVTFNTSFGVFDVGYQAASAWATAFADNGTTRPRIKFTTQVGPVTMLGIIEKNFESDTSAYTGAGGQPYAGTVDTDNNSYMLAGFYKFKGGDTGLLYVYQDGNSNRLAATPFKTKVHILEPYIKANIGPVYVEAEVDYAFGKAAEFDNGGNDLKKNGWAAYANAKLNLGPAYVGAQIGWCQGDNDPNDDTDNNGPSGTDWNPALILNNDDYATWQGSNGGRNTADNTKANILIYNVYGGYKLTPKMSFGAAFTYAQADKVAANVDKNMGYEFDATASYKLYDNLTYMVGAGYLWTGDFFKGANGAIATGNDYLLMNKLSLVW